MRSEKGSALFIILIAVALFAALSYAVTQSGRGSGAVEKEQVIIDAAKVVQYAGELRAAAQRLTLTGTAADSLQFGANDATNGVTPCTAGADCLFAPEGGGAQWNKLAGFMQWSYYSPVSGGESLFSVSGVGTAANDVIFWFWTENTANAHAICEQINKSLGRTTPVPVNGQFFGISSGEPGEPVGCDIIGASGYRFYVTLVEK